MQPINLEGMYGEPIRDNHLDHIFYVYQSETMGPIRNPPNMVLLMLLTNHNTPFLSQKPHFTPTKDAF